MEPIKLQRSVVKFDIYGTVYELRKAQWREVDELQDKVESCKDSIKEQMKLTGEYLVSLGLPKEVLDTLDAEHVNTIMEALAPKKKP